MTQALFHVANEVIRLGVRNGINPVHARILVVGLAVKENCPGLRNTRLDVCDPWVDAGAAKHEYGLSLCKPAVGEDDAIILAVGYEEFRKLGASGIRAHGKPAAVLYDVKYVLPRGSIDGRL